MKLLLILVGLLFYLPGQSCTTFLINKDGELIFGRNYDWVTSSGAIFVNQRGLAKTSSKTSDGNTISWVSQFGSITFNQYGKEFPTGGMNEKGLVVELMWLDGTSYPRPDSRPSVGVLQWIQYQLDNCATVEEVIASDKELRIASTGTTPLHYLIADANGKAATIEFLNGKMVVHTGNSLPFAVLTNNRYEESLSQVEPTVKTNTQRYFTDNSIDRFAKACKMVNEYQKQKAAIPIVDYAYSILENVAQGNHTKWSIVYDISRKKIYFKTREYPAIKNISFSAFSFVCNSASKSRMMNQAGEGVVDHLFTDFSLAINRELVEKSFEESKSQFSLSAERIRETWQYAGRIDCKEN